MIDERVDAAERARILQMRTDNQYEFAEYPKALYRDRPKGFKPPKEGNWVEEPPFETRIVSGAEEEAEAINDGWRLTAAKDAAK